MKIPKCLFYDLLSGSSPPVRGSPNVAVWPASTSHANDWRGEPGGDQRGWGAQRGVQGSSNSITHSLVHCAGGGIRNKSAKGEVQEFKL